MNKVLFFISTIILFAGCGSHIKTLEPKACTKLAAPSISINIPCSFPKIKWRKSGDTLYDSDNAIYFRRHLPNMMSEDVRITVGSPESLKKSTEKFLIKNFDYEKWAQEVLVRPDIVANMKERGVNYSKKYVDYIGGLKCGTDAESSSPALGVGFKKYYTVCGYYDTSGNKKRIDIMYHYISSFNGTKFQSDTTSTITSGKDIDTLFKQDMKAIFDSLVIHDMDRGKMSKEGLLHDKKYEIQEW